MSISVRASWALIAALTAPVAAIGAEFPTEIKGNNTQTAELKTGVAIAGGNDSVAIVAQNAIYEGTKIEGDNKQTAKAKTLVAIAGGKSAYATAIQNGVGVPKP